MTWHRTGKKNYLGRYQKSHKPKKCAVCGKALVKRNKVGLCSIHHNMELTRNRDEQRKVNLI